MPKARLDHALRALLARFHRQRPLRSGSLLITILGDAIAPRGGAVTLGSLIKLAQPFKLPERLVRTTVGRLAQDGWLSSRRAGRQSEYTLTRHGRERFAEATQRIYSEPPRDWDRRWTLLLVPNSSKHRERIREEMRWLGFGQLTGGVLAHPGRSVADVQRLLADMGLTQGAIVLEAASGGLQQDRQLISTGWDLAELAQGYRRFIASFETIQKAIAANNNESTPQQAFVIRTLLIHEYRKIHLRDPLLPQDLLPPNWVGTEAYDLCRKLYEDVFSAAEAYVSANACRLQGPLASPAPGTHTRFGIDLSS